MNHKYVQPVAPCDEAGYSIENGVIVDETERPNARKAYDDWTRFWRKTSAELRAEEAEWASRSGPVEVRYAS